MTTATPAAENCGEMLTRMGTDAQVWANEFMKRHPGLDKDDLIGWFANAIEAGRSAGIRQHSVDYWRSLARALGAPE